MAEAWPSREASSARSEANARRSSSTSRSTRRRASPGSPIADPRGRVDRRLPRGRPVRATRADRDAFVREIGIRSVIAAPLIHRDVVVGVDQRLLATGPTPSTTTDAGLLAALADQAAVAIANARLIEELERSRAEIARRADAERTLREIAARVSAILDPAEVLQQIVDEAARLLESDGARIDQYDPEIDALRWSYAAGDAMAMVPELGEDRRPQAGPGGGRHWPSPSSAPVLTTTTTSPTTGSTTTTAIDAFVRDAGIRAVISTPLLGRGAARSARSRSCRASAGRLRRADVEVLTALATQASIAIRNARLMEELARSRAVIERRAEAEHALREIAARITAIREPGDLLQRIVDEALRLLRADGAVIDEFDPDRGRPRSRPTTPG